MFIIVPNFHEFAGIKWGRQLDKWKSYLHILLFCTINTFEIESISKEINCAEHEYLNMSPHVLNWRSHWWNWHYFKMRYILNVNSFDTRYISLTALLHNKGRSIYILCTKDGFIYFIDVKKHSVLCKFSTQGLQHSAI